MHAPTIDTRPLYLLQRGLGTRLVHASSSVFLSLWSLLCIYSPCVGLTLYMCTPSNLNPNPIVHCFDNVICALCKKGSLCTLARRLWVSRKGGAGRGGWGHTQGDVAMAAARLGCKRPWLALGGPILALTSWAGLEITTLTLYVGGSLLAGKASWVQSGYFPTKSADYCMLVNQHIIFCTVPFSFAQFLIFGAKSLAKCKQLIFSTLPKFRQHII